MINRVNRNEMELVEKWNRNEAQLQPQEGCRTWCGSGEKTGQRKGCEMAWLSLLLICLNRLMRLFCWDLMNLSIGRSFGVLEAAVGTPHTLWRNRMLEQCFALPKAVLYSP